MDEDNKPEKDKTEMEYDTEECSLLFQQEEELPPPPESPIKKEVTKEILLEPDHPLLARFQEALKQQLLNQIEKLKDEVTELEFGVKKKSEEREQLGVSVYDAQQIVALQYESIEQYENEIKKLTTERKEIEDELVNISESHKEIRNKLTQAEKKEMELRNETDTMNFMYQKMSEWENKLQSELAVHQRISDKTKVDKKQFAEEKRNLDFLIYKLMTEVFRLENSLEHLDMQLRVKEHERDNLATSISNANADIESLEHEHKRLMHSWNCVLVAINLRDKLYNTVKKDLEKEQEALQNVLTEISAMKKSSIAEMTKNEQLTLVKGRIDMEKATINAKITHESEKLNHLEKKFIEVQSILSQTNKDLDEIMTVKRFKEQDLNEIQREIEKHINIKVEIEERILVMLQEQISSDKISKYMNKTIRDLRENNKTLEIQLAAVENKNAGMVVEIEHQKITNQEILRYIEDVANRERIHENELNERNNELKSIMRSIHKTLIKFDEATKKYEEAIIKTGGVEMTPTEVKVKELEKCIQEFDEKNSKLKAFWLTQQRYIISMREDRQKQLSEMNLIRKQIMLLQQKNLKLEDELEELDNHEKRFEKTMTNMKFKIDKINTEIWQKRGLKENLDVTTTSVKRDYMLKLKEAELDCIKLEDQLLELEEEKTVLNKELLEYNREALAWERKVKLAQETKQTIIKERSSEGEVGNMKAEIHRMSVRYSQLRKAQEKLVQDLNHCISRREFIFINSIATEKRLSLGGKVHNRTNTKRKLEDMRNKLKKFENEKTRTEEKINQACEMENELYEKILENENILEDMKTKLIEVSNNIDSAKFERQKELEILVFKQHKLQSFTSILKGQYRPKYRTDTSLQSEYYEQKDKNSKLQTIVENLILDFPSHYPDFAKILNSLKVLSTYID